VDPLTCKSDKDFIRKYNLAYAKAMAFTDLINLLASQSTKMEQLRKELESPEKEYSIG
jgi:hypothetical protein